MPLRRQLALMVLDEEILHVRKVWSECPANLCYRCNLKVKMVATKPDEQFLSCRGRKRGDS
ncbi:hypothetical protein BJV78DRAFT_1198079 [Lactifluus subvellereus]|nr:hypothetical protein BJV78DRAFT_1198079 [Lactifluus subvellereus]